MDIGGLITAALAIIEQLLQTFGVGGSTVQAIEAIVVMLEKIAPLITGAYAIFAPAFQNIKDAISADPSTTADQLARLKALDVQSDTAFEDAATAAGVGLTAPGTPTT